MTTRRKFLGSILGALAAALGVKPARPASRLNFEPVALSAEPLRVPWKAREMDFARR